MKILETTDALVAVSRERDVNMVRWKIVKGPRYADVIEVFPNGTLGRRVFVPNEVVNALQEIAREEVRQWIEECPL